MVGLKPGKHDFAKLYDCPNSILDKIITHSLHGFNGYIKAHFLKEYEEDCTMGGLLCM